MANEKETVETQTGASGNKYTTVTRSRNAGGREISVNWDTMPVINLADIKLPKNVNPNDPKVRRIYNYYIKNYTHQGSDGQLHGEINNINSLLDRDVKQYVSWANNDGTVVPDYYDRYPQQWDHEYYDDTTLPEQRRREEQLANYNSVHPYADRERNIKQAITRRF